MSIAYIGIGSNLGNREENCHRAIQLLENKGIVMRKRSSLYETEPWGVKDQPKFINMAIEIETELEPEELLKTLKDIEKEVGREESFRWGPRIIDLDILLFDDIILDKDYLRIPHPFMHERDFVLKPLCEIAPDKKHPVIRMSVHDLLQRLNRNFTSGHSCESRNPEKTKNLDSASSAE
ncbi:MAG: 2-amino-4-hydroxy-6-hydroxymethyldihydropteridine diphosphokinase [Nitrospira sp.]|nr:2-amino-4-hydroxy-6-hydroxymethyldihydropteridine diphosphokinase [Nitrospira sp.]